MRFLRIPLIVLWVLAAIATAGAAPVQFNLPAQPATTALLAFAKQAGVEVIFSSDDLKPVQTNAVVGLFEPAVALATMLQGTHFTAKANAAGKFVVQRDKEPKDATGRPRRSASTANDPNLTPESLPDDDIVRLEDMVVTPSRFGIAEERVAAEATLTNTELEALPQLGEDLFRTITRLPGLATDDLSARFWVRGAPHRQLLSRLDGVDLIEPFHLKDYEGALSIVDVETIGSINLVTGGLTAEHGDRLAGVLDMETQADPGARRRTTLGLSVTHLRATSQGEFADGKGQWLAAARRGYIDLALKLGGTDVGDAPTYYDFSGKIEYRFAAEHAFSLHVLHATDSFHRTDEEDEPDLRSKYGSSYVWGRWRGDFGDRLSGEGVLSFSQLDWRRDGDGLFDNIHPFTLRDRRRLETVSLRQDWTLNLTEHALVRAGFEVKSGEARYDYAMARTRWRLSGGELGTEVLTVNADLDPDGEYAAAYLAPRLQLTPALIIEPGLRFERHSHTDESGWSPRLNASLALGRRTTVRAAWGRYEQAQGLHELSVGDGETTFKPSERAEQRVVGVSHQLPSGLQLRLEAYERLNSRLRPHWENLIDVVAIYPEALYDRVRLDPTRGRARGVEVIAEHRTGERFGWGASYVYASTEERLGARWVPRDRDQRHSFYADVTWVPAPRWRLSWSWQIHTGWPFTDITFAPHTLNDGTVLYPGTFGQPYALRAPAYHRLDFRATRDFQLKHGTMQVFVDIFNVYSHKNEYGFDDPGVSIVDGQVIIEKPPLKMFPILPSVGVNWEF